MRGDWSAHKPPKCWSGTLAQWQASFLVLPAVPSPCVDCTPEFREQMRASMMCQRPEVVFIQAADGSAEGVTAEDNRYALLLSGSHSWNLLSAGPEPDSRWKAMIEHVARRATPKVKAAIKVWRRRHFPGVG